MRLLYFLYHKQPLDLTSLTFKFQSQRRCMWGLFSVCVRAPASYPFFKKKTPSSGRTAHLQYEANEEKRQGWSPCLIPPWISKGGREITAEAKRKRVRLLGVISRAQGDRGGPGARGSDMAENSAGSAHGSAAAKAQLRSSPRLKKLEKLAVYSSCKVRFCKPLPLSTEINGIKDVLFF